MFSEILWQPFVVEPCDGETNIGDLPPIGTQSSPLGRKPPPGRVREAREINAGRGCRLTPWPRHL